MEAQEGLTLVVGLGLIGGSIARRLTRAGWRVVGVDPDPATRTEARAAGAIITAYPDVEQVQGRARLVVLATPPSVTKRLVRRSWPEQAVVTDCSSVKQSILEAVPSSLEAGFVGGHPMAGNEGSGFRSSDLDLFEGRPWILTPADRTSPASIERVEQMIQVLGGNPIRMSASEHDRQVALLSHLPNLLAAILISMDSEAQRLDIASGSWASATRVAGGNPDLWADILLANRSEVEARIARLMEHLSEARSCLAAGRRDALLQLLTPRAGR